MVTTLFCMPILGTIIWEMLELGKLYTSCVDRESITTTGLQLTDRFSMNGLKYKTGRPQNPLVQILKHNLFLVVVNSTLQFTPDKLVSFLESGRKMLKLWVKYVGTLSSSRAQAFSTKLELILFLNSGSFQAKLGPYY